MKKLLWKACFAALALTAAATSAPAQSYVYCCSEAHCCGPLVTSSECSAAGGVGYSTRAVCAKSCELEICWIVG